MKILYLSILLFAQNSIAQDTTDLKLIALKKKFSETFKDDFSIVEDTILPDKDGIKYWLVTVKPKKEGFYTIRHIFQYENDWGYKNNSHEYQISVGKKGKKRFVSSYYNPFNQACVDISLGDSITIPISLDKHIIKHKFSKESEFGLEHSFDKEVIKKYNNHIKSKNLLKWTVKNNISELEFLSITKDEVVSPNPRFSTITYRAIFRAKEVGKFNINIDKYESVPITIYPKKESIKTLTGIVYTSTWDDDDESSSSSSTAYELENSKLRVEDILIVTFLAYNENSDDKKKIKKDLIISKTDFSMSGERYDYWLNEK